MEGTVLVTLGDTMISVTWSLLAICWESRSGPSVFSHPRPLKGLSSHLEVTPREHHHKALLFGNVS